MGSKERGGVLLGGCGAVRRGEAAEEGALVIGPGGRRRAMRQWSVLLTRIPIRGGLSMPGTRTWVLRGYGCIPGA